MNACGEPRFEGLRKLADLGRQIEDHRPPEPYPRPTGPPPTLDELRSRRDEITRIAARRGARSVSVFGSVARGDSNARSDLDLLVDMGNRSTLFGQVALQGDLEDLLGCHVHVVTTSGLMYARGETREAIEREAVPL